MHTQSFKGLFLGEVAGDWCRARRPLHQFPRKNVLYTRQSNTGTMPHSLIIDHSIQSLFSVYKLSFGNEHSFASETGNHFPPSWPPTILWWSTHLYPFTSIIFFFTLIGSPLLVLPDHYTLPHLPHSSFPIPPFFPTRTISIFFRFDVYDELCDDSVLMFAGMVPFHLTNYHLYVIYNLYVSLTM